MRGCIQNIKHINAFMLMSINRCLDYTKASNGVKLVPHLDTINLADTVNLPLQCLQVNPDLLAASFLLARPNLFCSNLSTIPHSLPILFRTFKAK